MRLGDTIRVKLTPWGLAVYDRKCFAAIPVRLRDRLIGEFSKSELLVEMKLSEFCSIFGPHMDSEKPLIVGELSIVTRPVSKVD